MPCVIVVRTDQLGPGGLREITGCATMNAGYVSGGDNFDLSNYFKLSTVPTVVAVAASGYLLEHNQGTAASGRIKAYQNVRNTNTMNGIDGNAALYECHTGLDLSSVNFVFIAKGQAY